MCEDSYLMPADLDSEKRTTALSLQNQRGRLGPVPPCTGTPDIKVYSDSISNIYRAAKYIT